MTSKLVSVTATALDDTGHGTGDAEGTLVHALDLLPGEAAEVAIDHASPHRAEAWGHVVRQLGEPSPARVAPACPGFGRCGGCAWQHLAYDEQLAHKRARVVAALAGVAPADAVASVRPAPATLGYRNKGKYVVGRDGDRVVFGAFAPRTHAVVDTIGCRVVAPIVDEVAAWIRGAAEASGIVPYDERTHSGELRYVVVRCNRAGDVLAGLVTTTATARARVLAIGRAVATHPALRGLLWIRHDRRDGAIAPAGAAAEVLTGAATLGERVSGVDLELGIGEFLQINDAQATALYARVVELAKPAPGVRAIDLYAGVGGIALAMAAAGATVTAIELDGEACATLRRAAAAQPRVTVIAADAAAVAEAAPGPLDVIVVNPPRKGLSEAAHAAVLGRAPTTLIYVSCGPESLGRDLARWVAAGYELDTIEPFDLMPGTSQIETVVRARRQPASR